MRLARDGAPAYLEEASSCQGFAPEDAALQMFCKGADPLARRGFHLRQDANQRNLYAPFRMHRDRYCNPAWEISVEDALAKPSGFSEALYDSYSKTKAGIDSLIVPAISRGEENLNYLHKLVSLKAWVYITSSADSSVPPGLHRLLDLPVFGAVECKPPVGYSGPPSFSTLATPSAVYEAPRRTSAGARWWPHALLDADQRALCAGAAHPEVHTHAVADLPNCGAGDLELVSRPGSCASKEWMKELTAPPPQPPPTSP